jgi:hypothetical protein
MAGSFTRYADYNRINNSANWEYCYLAIPAIFVPMLGLAPYVVVHLIAYVIEGFGHRKPWTVAAISGIGWLGFFSRCLRPLESSGVVLR